MMVEEIEKKVIQIFFVSIIFVQTFASFFVESVKRANIWTKIAAAP